MSLSYLGSAFNNSNSSNYVLTNSSNQWGAAVLNMVPMDNSLARALIYMSSNSATNYSSNLSFSQGDSNNRLSVDITSSNCALKFNGSALVSCNLQPIYNSNVELAVRTRLDTTKVYYNRSLLINYVGSNLDFSTGNFIWSASNNTNASNTTYISYPSLEGVFTVSNSLEVLSSSKFQNINAGAITATSISTPALTTMSNLLYGVSNSTFISNVSASIVTSPLYVFDSNQIPQLSASNDSVTLLVGSTSNDSFNVVKNGNINLLKIQSGLTNSAVFNSTLDATSITEGSVALTTKYAQSNTLSNYVALSNFVTYSNSVSASISTLSNSFSNYPTFSNFNSYSNFVSSNFRLNSGTVPWGSITDAPSFNSGSGGGMGSLILNGLLSGAVSVATSYAADSISVGGKTVAQWSSDGFKSLQGAVSDFVVDGLTSKISGIKQLLSPKAGGSPFMSYNNATDKVSLLSDYGTFGDYSVHIDGTANVISITQSNGNSNVYLGLDKAWFSSNVGIGVTSPSYKLDVAGTINTSSNLQVGLSAAIGSNISANTRFLINNPVTGGAGSGDYTNYNNSTMTIQDVTYPRVVYKSGSSTVGAVHSFESNKDVYWGESTDTGFYTFRGRTLSGTNVTMSGNVGFGVSSPSNARLEVSNNATGKSHLILTGSAYNSNGWTNTSGVMMALGFNSNNNRQLWFMDSANSTQNTTNVAARIGLNAGAVYIDAVSTDGTTAKPISIGGAGVILGGNVGIGTASPTQKLDVAGHIVSSGNMVSSGIIQAPSISGTTSVTTPLLQCTAGAMSIKSEYEMYYTADYDGNNGGAAHVFFSNSNEKMRISAAGNVGIGTNNPAFKLDVSGVIYASSNLLVSGNVGIGTASPAQKLDVVGTTLCRNGNTGSTSTNNQILFSYAGTQTYTHAIKSRHNVSDTSNAIDFYVWQSSDTSSGIGTKQVMTLDTNGVGIGTTTPSQKLDVVGNINASGAVTAASLTTTGTAQAAKISCGYISVADYSVNSAAYASDVFSY